MEKHFRTQTFFGVVTLLAIIIAFTASTFAWFTYSPDTNVEPIRGGIGHGEGNLLIAGAPEGPFSNSCALVAFGEDTLLRPLSTADLVSFYSAVEQNRSGISIGFARDDNFVLSAVCGSLYLQSERAGSAVYFDRGSLDFGSDAQALASMRLGLKITTAGGTVSHIFRLDSMGDTSGVEARQTVEQSGAVVAAVDAAGRPSFVTDPAADISAYCAAATDDIEYPVAGENMLCLLSADEVARVDYYLYLEGCDDNCINAVQSRAVALSLGFAGVTVADAAA